MIFQRQFQVGLILAILFLGLWSFHTQKLFKIQADQSLNSHRQYIGTLGGLLKSEIEKSHSFFLDDPFLFYTFAKENELEQVILMDEEGKVLLDSSDYWSPGEWVPMAGAEKELFDQVKMGSPGILGPFLSEPDTWSMTYFSPYLFSDTKNSGIAAIRFKVPSSLTRADSTMTGLLLKILGGVILVVVIYTFVRSIRNPKKGGFQPMDEQGTMVETFQGLVRQLKEKESELQDLKIRAEQRAADVESYNENILQSVASGVITFDRERKITTFNPAAERVLGIERQHVMGQTAETVFGAESPIDRMLQEVFYRETVLSRQEFELQRPISKDYPMEPSLPELKGGRSYPVMVPERIWVGVSTSLLRDGAGQIIGATFVFTDLTEIKRLQEQIELRRRLTVLGEMSAGIAHEFRNFMGTIMGFAKLISKRSDPDDPRHEMVVAITEELHAMDRLIEQLLSFGRHIELNLSSVDLESLIRKIVDLVMNQAEGRLRPSVTFQVPSKLPMIRLDDVLVRQAFTNLIQNAIEAMPNGGELEITMRAHQREDSSGGRSGEMVVEIRDSGIGIPKEKQEKIFLPFFTMKEKGTGLGLALVHKIILSHNGRISVESGEGQGTTFQIHLPLK